jgi:hypothetical protein
MHFALAETQPFSKIPKLHQRFGLCEIDHWKTISGFRTTRIIGNLRIGLLPAQADRCLAARDTSLIRSPRVAGALSFMACAL